MTKATKETKAIKETLTWIGMLLLAAVVIALIGINSNIAGTPPAAGSEARNVIFFHVDGYGLSHWNSLRVWLKGPDGRLNWDKLPHMAVYTGHMKDGLTGSSHGGATVHAYGVKVAQDSFGLDGRQEITALSGKKMSIMEEAIEAGFATAFVQSGCISHPGTAAFVASVEAKWGWVTQEGEIARQVIESGVDVILGGGEQWLLPEGVTGRHGKGGRKDGVNLIERAKELGYTVVYTRDELMAAAANPAITRVLGVFASGYTFNAVSEEALRAKGLPLYWPWAPTIAEMSRAALDILSRNPKAAQKGMFIVAEEEGTDDFGNVANASGSFEAGKRADEAFGVFMQFIKKNPNTLLITTADSNASGKVSTGGCPGLMALLLPDGKALEVNINTGPDGQYVKAPTDGVKGARTEPFLTAPDKQGKRFQFVVAWAMHFDVYGDILARAKGLNAEKVTELGIVDNTDIYRIMYYTLFGKWLGEAR
ncbi:alkaline phosphatase [Candidatus Acetothermia bacterium]|jgi:alkaline phosphatase|nr:alkaline phosphatase [Candidatus Acetothermia bacterium]